MENPTAFDVNEAISRWREGLRISATVRLEDIDELEWHLRDSAASLEARGLTPAEAFLVAQRRLGSPDALNREFGKVDPATIWFDRAMWMVAGFLLISWLTSLARTASILAGTAGFVQALSGPALAFISALTWLGVLLGTGLLAWRVMTRHAGGPGDWIRRHPIPAAAGLAVLLLLGLAAGQAPNVLAARVGPVAYGKVLMSGGVVILLLNLVVWPVAMLWLLRRAGSRTRLQRS